MPKKTQTVKLPLHVALIPDGNRRWAKSHNLPTLMGHRQVMEKVFPTLVTQALNSGLKYFTIWGFSTENWHRSEDEVNGLFTLGKLFFQNYGQKFKEQGIRLVVIGRRDNISAEFNQIIEHWQEATESNTKMQLTIAFNYGGRDEIVRAINKILAQGNVHEVGEDTFANYLDTSVTDMPDPDLIIRTSGEQRLSGFMSWQSAYSELYFSQKTMPDWTADDLLAALADYAHRERRYGK